MALEYYDKLPVGISEDHIRLPSFLYEMFDFPKDLTLSWGEPDACAVTISYPYTCTLCGAQPRFLGQAYGLLVKGSYVCQNCLVSIQNYEKIEPVGPPEERRRQKAKFVYHVKRAPRRAEGVQLPQKLYDALCLPKEEGAKVSVWYDRAAWKLRLVNPYVCAVCGAAVQEEDVCEVKGRTVCKSCVCGFGTHYIPLVFGQLLEKLDERGLFQSKA